MLKPNKAELSFQLGDEIGAEGKNSSVYKARDLQLDADIVVKKIEKKTFSDIDEYFLEASLLYLSAHANVVPIHYACQDEGHVYLAMPFFAKGSLKSLMESRALTVREIIVISTQVLSGLHNIHSKGLIHFDVKPDNVLLSDRGEALLSDFGLAKQTSYAGIAGQDRIYGKMVPPEAFSKAEFTRQFDIYQMGLTMHRMCVGDERFYAEYNEYLDKDGALDREQFRFAVRNGRFPDTSRYPEHIPKKIAAAIRVCLSRDLSQRFSSAVQVVNAIANIDEVLLDWKIEHEPGRRRWRKKVDQERELILVVEEDGSSTAYYARKDGRERKVKKYCSSRLTRRDIKRFIRENGK